jgi:hypothetical protein
MSSGAGLRAAVRDVAQRASAVARLQAELFKAELADTGKNAGVGVALVIGAAFLGVFAFGLLTALFVVALANVLPLWLSILIVLVVYLGLAALLGLLARNHFSQAKGAPRAAEQARLTREALGLSRSADGGSPRSTPTSQRPGEGSTGTAPAAPPAVAPTSDRGPDAD